MSDNGLPVGWASSRFGELWTLSQNGCGARRGTGTPTVVLRLADVTVEGRIAADGLREIPLSDGDREKYALANGDLLAFRVNGSPQITGQVVCYPGPAGNAFCDHFIRFRVPEECLDPRFVAYAFRVPPCRSQVARAMVSTAGQNTVSQKSFFDVNIPVPPLLEQRRIVEAIESYFTRLDDAVATLERVQRNLKRYRASVLKAAVEGRLVPTEAELARVEGGDFEPASVLLERILAERRRRWQEAGRGGKYREPLPPDISDLSEVPEGWRWATVEQFADHRLGKMLDKDKNQGTPHPYLRNANVRWFEFDLADVSEMRVQDEQLDEVSVRAGDVVVCEGGEPGRAAVWQREGQPFVIQKALHRVRVARGVSPWFFAYLLAADAASGRLGQSFTGSTIRHFTGETLQKYCAPIPPEVEQQRIVEAVDDALSLIAAAERTAAAAQRRCVRLRQAVLKWAFEGKLADQNPADEPAPVLLERLRAERAAAAPPRATTRVRARRLGPRAGAG